MWWRDVSAYTALGLTRDQATRWLDAGMTADDAASAMRAGFGAHQPKEAAHWMEDGSRTPKEAYAAYRTARRASDAAADQFGRDREAGLKAARAERAAAADDADEM
jgi:hypothetical protein